MGLWSAYATHYAVAMMLSTTLLFALPLFFVPLTWARLFQWRIPEHTHLAIYFGRCLGSFALVTEGLLLRGLLHGEHLQAPFDIMIPFSALMVLVHIWGAVRRIQPWTETAEILMWAAICALSVLCYPV